MKKKYKVRIGNHKKQTKSFLHGIIRNKLFSTLSVVVLLIAIPVTVLLSLNKTQLLNFAATSPYAIRGSIWLDTGEGYPPDGQWNNNEVASTFSNWPTITLHGSNGISLQTTPTNGGYSFENLTAGIYSVSVSGFSPTNQSSLQNIQLSTANPVNNGVNIGYYTSTSNGGSNSIKGSIWLDTQDPGGKPDGIYNNGELPAVFTGNPQIHLKDIHTGQQWETTPTEGGYSFQGLAAGTYSITVNGFSPTNPNDLSNINLQGNNTSMIVNIGYYTGNTSGLTGNANISGSIWIDANGNGVWDNGEQPANNGVPGIQIILEDSATRQIAATTTTGAGFGFNNLATGTYTIAIHGFTPTNQSQLTNFNVAGNGYTVNIGYNPNGNINSPAPTQTTNGNGGGGNSSGGNNTGGNSGGSTVVCSSSSNPQCSFSSSCSTEGQTCQCADKGWANHDKVYQCTGGNWKYQSDTSTLTCKGTCQ